MENRARVTLARPILLTGAIAVLAIAAIPFAALLAKDGPAPFTVVETGKGYGKLQAAVDAIGGGKGTIAIGAWTCP